MNQIYYIPIKSENLAHYYVKGCICPTKYIENRNQDIQNFHNTYVLLCDSKFTKETNCALEIVLDKNNETVEKISKNFSLLKIPIPISRVKSIYFQNERQKKITVFNITSGAAFLPPDSFIKVASDEEIQIVELNNTSTENNRRNWTDKLKKFNQLMGGLAMMRIAGDKFPEYPLNYFSTISSINLLIKDEISNQSIPVTNNHEWAIIGNGEFTELIYSKINNNAVENHASKNNIELQKRNGKFIIENIKNDSITYILAVLASYGEGARMKIDTFISDFFSNKFPEKKKEGLALTFGINKGYTAFRNSYKTQNFEADIKFKLDSQLDYYIIESIYQFAFNNKKNNRDFHYIDSWSPKLKENDLKGYNSYEVLDKKIFYKKKETVSQVSFQKFFPTISQENMRKILNSVTNNDFEDFSRLLNDEVDKKYKVKISEFHSFLKEKDNKIDALEKQLNGRKTGSFYNEKTLFDNLPQDDSDERRIELSNLKLSELKKIATEKNLKSRSKYKKKQDLISALIKQEFNQ